ncbi:divalent-cation tolerance protein CutA [Anthocerotibacter panamensis]|uniref:divalent-cation tolerance protein CutA n=1 Tax=Anthocerotibacter panamensis TaxID=2857077 RepID=UPI001C40170B|nr:divalent-cation tolerance protein CutA [Anthocerotibacter panamensis]
MTEYIQVLTTTPDQTHAQDLAQKLVEQKLAGCVQILGPITSTYRWQGAIETATEWLCIIKSRNDLYPVLEHTIRANHPYAVPEVLAVAVVAGSAGYLGWLEGALLRREAHL